MSIPTSKHSLTGTWKPSFTTARNTRKNWNSGLTGPGTKVFLRGGGVGPVVQIPLVVFVNVQPQLPNGPDVGCPVGQLPRLNHRKIVIPHVQLSLDLRVVDKGGGNVACPLAPFVHPKVGGKTIPNAGYQTKSYTPVLIAPNKITTVDDLLERSAGRR